MHSRPEKFEKEVRGRTGLCRVAAEPTDLLRPFQLRWAIQFAGGFATEMSVVEIFLEELLVRDTARFRGAIVTVS